MSEILAPFAVPTLPGIFRALHVERERIDTGYRMTAELHHAAANPHVTWSVRHPDIRLKAGVLVKPIQMKSAAVVGETIPIHHLMVLERPEANLNLFETVPAPWVGDTDLLVRGGILWDLLPAHLKGLFNTVFWDGWRFRRYCQGQSSLQGHHDGLNGNLRHSIEVAETVVRMLPLYESAHGGIAVLAALLHDAGKADEYQPCGSGMRMSDLGKLWGHKTTVTTWLAVAREKMKQGVPETHFQSLVHALTAVPGAPAWMGLREPATPEAMLLSTADRLSGHADLMNRCMRNDGGWGESHPHLKAKPFTTPPNGIVRQEFAGLEALWQRVKAEKEAKKGAAAEETESAVIVKLAE